MEESGVPKDGSAEERKAEINLYSLHFHSLSCNKWEQRRESSEVTVSRVFREEERKQESVRGTGIRLINALIPRSVLRSESVGPQRWRRDGGVRLTWRWQS